MKNNKFYKLMTSIGRKAAVKSSGTASAFGIYQSKEPKSLKNLKK